MSENEAVTSNGNSEQLPKPKRPRKPQTNLSKEQWRRVKLHYESSDLSLAKLAPIYSLSLSTLEHKSADEGWAKDRGLVRDARGKLQEATDQALTVAAAKAGDRIASKLLERLEPWIEREKVHHIKDSVRRAKRGLKRLDILATEDDNPLTAKDEAFVAKSVDTYDMVKRRNLGMSDGKQAGGSLSLRILAGQAAVQVVSEAA